MTLSIERIDHIVITVNDIEKTCRFYCDVLGMTETQYDDNRRALYFGRQKINLHPIPNDINPIMALPLNKARLNDRERWERCVPCIFVIPMVI